MWQMGVRARLRLLQDDWAAAEQDARAVLAAGEFPLGRLWPHLVLGLLAARRDAPPENSHLDELWKLAGTLDNPSKITAAAAALAEQAWILRRPDPRLADPRVAALFGGASADRGRAATADSAEGAPANRDPGLCALRAWARRLADAGLQELGPLDTTAVGTTAIDTTACTAAAVPTGPYERALAGWDEGSVDALLAALPLLDDLGARAVAALFRGRLRDRGVTGIPRGRSAATRSNPAGLTERQLDVLALLVEGLTNAEIAARLVISHKTADHHVSAILGKLDVRTRREAAARARHLGV
jgi:DNA-binding CsgD family transcriptional regulator